MKKSPFEYCIYDVFTEKTLTGNPLAVVFDAEPLSSEQMLAIAREFNLSETVFVKKPVDPKHAASLRIFTPRRELPFAGHPTVGAAIALSERNGPALDQLLVLEEEIGPVRCAIRGGKPCFSEFDLPMLPVQNIASFDRGMVATALGLKKEEIGFENHLPTVWSAGNPFAFIPVRDLAAIESLSIDSVAMSAAIPYAQGRLLNSFIYCRETVNHNCAFHARMINLGLGVIEDPATGSAVAALAGVIQHFDGLDEGANSYWIEQGMEMKRPSRIRLEITAKSGEIQSARIGGHAVRVATGTLSV